MIQHSQSTDFFTPIELFLIQSNHSIDSKLLDFSQCYDTITVLSLLMFVIKWSVSF